MNEVLLPMPEHLRLLNYLSIMVLLIHVPYIGMLIGSTLISLISRAIHRIEPNEKVRQFGKDILNIIPEHFGFGIILGIAPLNALMLLYALWFYETKFAVHDYFKVII